MTLSQPDPAVLSKVGRRGCAACNYIGLMTREDGSTILCRVCLFQNKRYIHLGRAPIVARPVITRALHSLPQDGGGR